MKIIEAVDVVRTQNFESEFPENDLGIQSNPRTILPIEENDLLFFKETEDLIRKPHGLSQNDFEKHQYLHQSYGTYKFKS